MALRAVSSVFLSYESSLSDDNSALDALIEENADLNIDRYIVDTPKQSYVQSMVSRLDWYKTGNGGSPFSGFSDFGAEFGIQESNKECCSAFSSGGNVVFQKIVSPPTTPKAPEVACPALLMKPSRKRNLESTMAADQFQLAECRIPRRRVA